MVDSRSAVKSTIAIWQIEARSDNYIYLLRNATTGETAVVDPSDAKPVLDALDSLGWDRQSLTKIINTHHHDDHIAGNRKIQEATGAIVVGPKADAHRIELDVGLTDGGTVDLLGMTGTVLATPGHTSGHISLFFKGLGALFCADTLFALGCGRLFEGTPAEMHASLAKFDSLPDHTLVLCAHEYTQSNADFCLSIDGDNTALVARAAKIAALRKERKSTVPSTLGIERQTNVFLRAGEPSVKAALGLAPLATDLEAFTVLRAAKDSF